MSAFKCKMCGGTIEFEAGATVGVCDSCGTKQTLPKTCDDNITNLFNRANNLRLKCEFDKAAAIYEKIVEQDDSEAEAHWGLILCKYGIEYVDDPRTGNKIPTCHRTQFDSVTSDPDYAAAIDYSDPGQQRIYENEARAIDNIQRDILSIVRNEKPFDVFICYKETDENGRRTPDSVLANDIYYQLTQENFKVFFAPITLEDKLGQEYEPYIFSALHSAKVMLVIGTKPEYFNAVWVRNEWSRFLKMIKNDRSKLLIPCYRDMDPYDFPPEFAYLQAQDMGKIGFVNDVVRGIKKVVNTENDNSGANFNDSNRYDSGNNSGSWSSGNARQEKNDYSYYSTPKRYPYKQERIFNLIDDFSKNVRNDNLRRDYQKKALETEKGKLPKFPGVSMVLMILGFIWGFFPGLIILIFFLGRLKKYNEGQKRAKEIDRIISNISEFGGSNDLVKHIKDTMSREGYPVTDQEISYCFLIKGLSNHAIMYGFYNGTLLQWIPIKKSESEVTLISRKALVSGPKRDYSNLVINTETTDFVGLSFSEIRLPDESEYKALKKADRECQILNGDKYVWWRLNGPSDNQGYLIDVTPDGDLNMNGHSVNDKTICYRPAIDVVISRL